VLWLPTGLAAAAAIAGLVALAQQRTREAPGNDPGALPETPKAVLAAPAPSWQPMPEAAPLFALEASGPGLPQGHAAQRHAGGGREDTLTLGGPGAPLRFHLAVTRGLSDADPPSFYVDLVHRAAEAGLAVERSAPPAPVATKFGTAEAAPATLGGLACLAVRFRHPELAFRLHGWLCGSDALQVDEGHLACLLDGLVLAGATGDAALRVLFAQAEPWRTGACGVVRWEAAPA
jgi:hypothetical protein